MAKLVHFSVFFCCIISPHLNHFLPRGLPQPHCSPYQGTPSLDPPLRCTGCPHRDWQSGGQGTIYSRKLFTVHGICFNMRNNGCIERNTIFRYYSIEEVMFSSFNFNLEWGWLEYLYSYIATYQYSYISTSIWNEDG